jgi:hypothetical protein
MLTLMVMMTLMTIVMLMALLVLLVCMVLTVMQVVMGKVVQLLAVWLRTLLLNVTTQGIETTTFL